MPGGHGNRRNSPYTKRKNIRRSIIAQAFNRLPEDEALLLKRAIQRHQERDRRRTFGADGGSTLTG